jgi:GTPase SAR1 family protein
MQDNAANNGGEYSSAPVRSSMNNYTGKNTYHHKIVLLGDMGVGKTCISIR